MSFAEAQQAVETVVYFIEDWLAAGVGYDQTITAASYRYQIPEHVLERLYDDYGGERKKGRSGETKVSCVAEQA